MAFFVKASFRTLLFNHSPQRLREAAPVTLAAARALPAGAPPRRLRYSGMSEYKAAADTLGMAPDNTSLPPGAALNSSRAAERYCYPVPAGPVVASGDSTASKEYCQVNARVLVDSQFILLPTP